MQGYSRRDLERDLHRIDCARAEVAAMIARNGQAPTIKRILDDRFAQGKITMQQAKIAYATFVKEGVCTGIEAQPVYDILEALENGYYCSTCGILQGRGVVKAHRVMGHRVITGRRERFKAAVLAAKDRDKEDKTVHAFEDVLEIVRKKILRLRAPTLAGRAEAGVMLESGPQARAPKESQRWKNGQEIEEPEWRHNLDATKGIGYPAREEGRYGSHAAHDGFDDESKP